MEERNRGGLGVGEKDFIIMSSIIISKIHKADLAKQSVQLD